MTALTSTPKSKTYRKAMCMAFSHENLMPFDCIDILKQVYGKRLDSMNPQTIFNIAADMMGHVSPDADYTEEIIEAVNDFIYS